LAKIENEENAREQQRKNSPEPKRKRNRGGGASVDELPVKFESTEECHTGDWGRRRHRRRGEEQ
jgi:hypothetical protein